MIKPVIFLICLVSVAVYAQGPPYDEVCETSKYPPDPSTVVPTYQVNLDLPAQERWKAIALKYSNQIRDLVSYIKYFILEFSPKLQKLIDLVDNDLGKVADTLPHPYGDEIKGIANATNIPLGELVLYNIFYEVFTLCTSIVGQDEQFNTLHARNLDFGLLLGWDLGNDTWIISEKLRPLIMTVEFTRNSQVQYKTVGFAGFVGLFTGVRANKVSISMNERFKGNGGYIGLFEWILNINRQQSWVTFLARDVLDVGLDYETAVQTLAQTPLLAPCYFIVGGPDKLQGSVITRDRASAADVWKLGTNNTWFLAETNYDHWEKPLFIDDRITPANRCMNKLGQSKFSFAGLFNVLSSKPVLNKLTVYTALMETKTGRVEAYVQYCPTPCWPF